MHLKVKAVVLGDMEVTVEYRVGLADRYVGDFSDYVDEWDITEINGEQVSPYLLTWVNSSLTQRDIKRILACCHEDMSTRKTDSVNRDFDTEC